MMKRLAEFLNKVVVGDVLAILKEIPNESIDLIITSPPYNKRARMRGWLVNKEKYSHFDDHMPEDEYQEWQFRVLNELFRITKPGGSLFYNHKIRWEGGELLHPLLWVVDSEWTLRQEIVWDRGLAANMRGWRYWQVDERIYWLYKPVDGNIIGSELASRHAKLSSIWRIKPARRHEKHPAPFPVEIPTRIIHSLLMEKTSVVLDPFCGTGTTLVASKLLGFNYIGIDVSPEYAELTKERIADMEQEKNKVVAEIAKHVIEDTFVARKKRGTISWPYGPDKEKDSLNGSETVQGDDLGSDDNIS
jgi:site-specific DNA-methyltransferase (adenine-specific)